MTAPTPVSATASATAPAVATAASAVDRVRAAYRRIAEVDRPEVWVHLRPEADALADAAVVDEAVAAGEDLPLAGTVLAVKDNVDVAGLPTTAGHPAFARIPDRTATAVARLQAAGAVVLGKTAMDQFATGLTGARSPGGPVRSAHHPDRVAGGSSSGSGAAVGLGIADLAIATDTAGSGRVPAAFNRVVGLKPTLGLVPTDGVVPACPSYDCVSVLAPTLGLAAQAVALMAGTTPEDPACRPWPATTRLAAPAHPRIAVPREADLAPLGTEARRRFAQACATARDAGAVLVTIDLRPFLEGARLLYGGALVAERYASFGEFLLAHPGAADPDVLAVARRAAQVGGPELVRDQVRLRTLRARALAALDGLDALLLPTTPLHPTLAQVAADPTGVNALLGTYTNFVNLFDLAAVAVPAGGADGGEVGVTVVTRAFDDQVALDVAAALLGEPRAAEPLPPTGRSLAVFGAHMRGEPLHGQMEALGARFVGAVATAPDYRMHLTVDGARPVVAAVAPGTGDAVPGEEWLLSPAALGELLSTVRPPLAIGPVRLADGREALGFTGAAVRGEPVLPAGWRTRAPHPRPAPEVGAPDDGVGPVPARAPRSTR